MNKVIGFSSHETIGIGVINPRVSKASLGSSLIVGSLHRSKICDIGTILITASILDSGQCMCIVGTGEDASVLRILSISHIKESFEETAHNLSVTTNTLLVLKRKHPPVPDFQQIAESMWTDILEEALPMMIAASVMGE